MSEAIPSTCYPVTGTIVFRGKDICQQNFSVDPTPLTKPEEGIVSCPLFQNGKCNGKMPCIIKTVYPEIKMVGPE
jgi:hypothetical protein